MAKARGDETALKAARARLTRADEKLDAFTEAHGRKRRREREYGPANAKWAEEPLTNGGGSDRIAPETWYGKNIAGKSEMEAKYQAALVKSKEAARMDGEFGKPKLPDNLSEYSFDAEHINGERRHNITREEAEGFIKDAVVSVTRNNGSYVNFYGLQGATYTLARQKLMRTAFPSEQYTPNIMTMIEVIRHELGIE